MGSFLSSGTMSQKEDSGVMSLTLHECDLDHQSSSLLQLEKVRTGAGREVAGKVSEDSQQLALGKPGS